MPGKPGFPPAAPLIPKLDVVPQACTRTFVQGTHALPFAPQKQVLKGFQEFLTFEG